MNRIVPLASRPIRTLPLRARGGKVRLEEFARPLAAGRSLWDFLGGLPHLLAARELRGAAEAIARAVRAGKVVAVGFGGHLVKVGLGPALVDLLERGVVGFVATNGSGAIHDYEIAFGGATSEEVEEGLGRGRYGVARETAEAMNGAARRAARAGMGLGRGVGRTILEERLPHASASILAAAARLQVPATVHVALGTDTPHIFPGADGGAIGRASLRDFRLFAGMVARLEGGVYVNVGSAVILPEVFLKALTLVRNQGHRVRHFTTVNLDFLAMYRPLTNVVRRPTREGGRGIALTGHHEILFPLLFSAVLELLDRECVTIP